MQVEVTNMSAEEQRTAIPKWAAAMWVAMALLLGVQSVVLVKLWRERPRERAAHRAERVCDAGQSAQPNATDDASVKPHASSPKKGNRAFADLDEFWRDFDMGKWDPLDEMKRMRERMNNLFDDSFGRFSLSPGADRSEDSLFGFSPKLDLQEKDDCYVARMDLPGANKDDISVKLDDRVLTVAGRIQESVEKKDRDQVLRKERRSGRFERTLTLPGPVLPDKMDARFENGVLAITIPKAKEDQQAKTIQVK